MKTTKKQALNIVAAAIAAAFVAVLPPQAQAQVREATAPRPAETTIAVPELEMQKLLATYALIKQNYVGQTDDKKLFDGALAGMLASLDAHSQYMDEEDMRELERSASGEYAGIGIEIEYVRERMHVISVTEGSPAERAGIAAGDVIVAIDGLTLAGQPDGELSRRLIGAPGTAVAVDVLSHGKLQSLRIVREPLRDATVHARMAARGVAWIRIGEFGGSTAADLAKALKELDGKAPPGGIVLDLRNDPGGLVPAGIAVAGAFLPQGAVVFSARGRDADVQTTVTVDPRFYRGEGEPDVLADLPAWTRSVPLAVLVNGASASAAELVAGALQDHGRATVIGTRTFGKGSIQTVVPLTTDSGIKFTVARYFTPNGHEIQAHGVTPDIPVTPAFAENDTLLLREADLDKHLPATQEESPEGSRAPFEPASMFGTRSDKALRTAVVLLKPREGGSLLGRLLRKLAPTPRNSL
jgi:carboxyl-terminal processing protease